MSHLDGKVVEYVTDPDWRGRVLCDSHLPGFVLVQWTRPQRLLSPHKPANLRVVAS